MELGTVASLDRGSSHRQHAPAVGLDARIPRRRTEQCSRRVATHVRASGWHVLVRHESGVFACRKTCTNLAETQTLPPRHSIDCLDDSQTSMQIEGTQVDAPGSSTDLWEPTESAPSMVDTPAAPPPAPPPAAPPCTPPATPVLSPDPCADQGSVDDGNVQHEFEYWAVSKAHGVWCQGCNQKWSHGRRLWKCKACSKPTSLQCETPRTVSSRRSTRRRCAGPFE